MIRKSITKYGHYFDSRHGLRLPISDNVVVNIIKENGNRNLIKENETAIKLPDIKIAAKYRYSSLCLKAATYLNLYRMFVCYCSQRSSYLNISPVWRIIFDNKWPIPHQLSQ